jgi:hypothetical protein
MNNRSAPQTFTSPIESATRTTRHHRSDLREARKTGDEQLTRGGGGEEHEAVVEVLPVAVERELGVVGEAEVKIEAARLERAEEGRVRGPHSQVVQEDQQAAPAGTLLGGRGRGREGRGGEGEEEEVPRRRHCCADLAGFCWVWSGAAQASSDGDEDSRGRRL